MPRIKEEVQQQHTNMLRLLMVRKSDLTVLEAVEAMAKNGYQLNKDYINKLMRKVRGERQTRVDQQKLNAELAKFEDLVNALADQLWAIITAKPRIEQGIVIEAPKPNDRVNAIRTLIGAYKDLFDKKFDAGVFERQLGKLKAEGALDEVTRAEIRKAFDYAFNQQPAKRGTTDKK